MTDTEIIIKNGTKHIETIVIKKKDKRYIYRGDKAKQLAHLINSEDESKIKKLVDGLE